MHPEWFVRAEPGWEREERYLLSGVAGGPVLDLADLSVPAAFSVRSRRPR